MNGFPRPFLAESTMQTSVYDEMRYCEAVDMMVDYSIVEVVEEIKADAAYAVDGAVSMSRRLAMTL